MPVTFKPGALLDLAHRKFDPRMKLAGELLKEEMKRLISFQCDFKHHSLPGDPPFRETGELMESVAVELKVEAGKTTFTVGPRIKLGVWLEFGTKQNGKVKMAARPFIRPIFHEQKPTILELIQQGQSKP